MEDTTHHKLISYVLPTAEMEELLKAGVHVGHAKSKRNPAMSQYVFGVRNNIEIIDIAKTVAKLDEALMFIKKIVAEGKKILLVGTKPAARRAVQEAGEETGMPYVTIRWIGGTLTNFKVISDRLAMLEDLEQKKSQGALEQYKKKEKIKLEEKLRNLQNTFAGVRNLKKLPDAIFVVDTIHDNCAVREAVRLNIPVIALVDTNTNPTPITYPIPSNDDALPAVRLVVGKINQAILDGKKEIKLTEGESSTPKIT